MFFVQPQYFICKTLRFQSYPPEKGRDFSIQAIPCLVVRTLRCMSNRKLWPFRSSFEVHPWWESKELNPRNVAVRHRLPMIAAGEDCGAGGAYWIEMLFQHISVCSGRRVVYYSVIVVFLRPLFPGCVRLPFVCIHFPVAAVCHLLDLLLQQNSIPGEGLPNFSSVASAAGSSNRISRYASNGRLCARER